MIGLNYITTYKRMVKINDEVEYIKFINKIKIKKIRTKNFQKKNILQIEWEKLKQWLAKLMSPIYNY